jgi:hypothetical protein
VSQSVVTFGFGTPGSIADVVRFGFGGASGACWATDDFSGTLANWTEHPNFTTGDFAISSAGRLRQSTAGTVVLYHNTAAPSADYTVSATFHALSLGASDIFGLVARVNTSASTFYRAEYLHGTGWRIAKTVAGSFGSIASYTATMSTGVDYDVDFILSGSSLSLAIDGAVVCNGTDTDITAAGYAGFRAGIGSTLGDSLGIQADNFSACPNGGAPPSTFAVYYMVNAGSLLGSGVL